MKNKQYKTYISKNKHCYPIYLAAPIFLHCVIKFHVITN